MGAASNRLVVAALTAGLVLVGCGSGGGRKGGTRMSLSSPAFSPNGAIPERFSCDGDDRPPPLSWTGVPSRAVELALTMEDPDAPGGPFVHWVVWGLSPNSGGLGEGTLPAGARQGRNGSAGSPGYIGPCPPEGPPHHYVFTLYALSRRLAVGDGSTIAHLRSAMAGGELAKATLVGTFGR